MDGFLPFLSICMCPMMYCNNHLRKTCRKHPTRLLFSINYAVGFFWTAIARHIPISCVRERGGLSEIVISSLTGITVPILFKVRGKGPIHSTPEVRSFLCFRLFVGSVLTADLAGFSLTPGASSQYRTSYSRLSCSRSSFTIHILYIFLYFLVN